MYTLAVFVLEEKFLLHDSGVNDGCNRILIFGRETHLHVIAGRNEQIYLDGTFSITPPLFQNGQVKFLLLIMGMKYFLVRKQSAIRSVLLFIVFVATT